jgi:UDP-N-acetyl-D-glucosamine dehydrogenase
VSNRFRSRQPKAGRSVQGLGGDAYTASMKIGTVGLGYVGLPLAVAFAEAGHEVVGLDTDPRKVEGLNAGRSHVEDVADASIAPLSGRLRATGNQADLASCEAIVICVPTPLTGSREPDLTYLLDSATALSGVLQPEQLVVLESTTYPGTTRERLLPILEESGLSAGRDFHLAFSPERIDPGRTDYTVRTTPKLVGGLTPACAERARELYALICDEVIVLSSPEAAELSKLLENIFRSVNIALVNELAQLCDRLEIDVWEVVDAAATKPFGFMRFDPGPGMGGHCLPVDPFYLAFKAREHDFYPEFIELAGKVNQTQPVFCVERIERALNGVAKPVNGSRILLLGVSYKAGVGDIRESPALKIARRLRDLGGDVAYHDPHVPDLPELGLSSVELEEGLAGCDVAAIVTAHPELDYADVVAAAPLVVDFRGITRGIEATNLVRL